jgi:mRNA-degrading endonuclease RelE of RelBE toxin-antitoxin system
MAFRITITEEAEVQLRALPARDQRILEAHIVARLHDRPTMPTKAIKRLRPNPVAEFELRVGDLRVVDDEVTLHIIGRKVGNTLVVKGEEYDEHQADPPEPPRGGSAGDPE